MRDPRELPDPNSPDDSDLALGETVLPSEASEASTSDTVLADTVLNDDLRAQGAVVESQVRAYSLTSGTRPGTFEEQYELGPLLGSGGMGAVYRAEDQSLHRRVAVKVMHDEVAQHDVMVRRFYKEAQIAAQLEHPGIVPTYGIEVGASGHPRLSMRLIRGEDLQSMIEGDATRLDQASSSLEELRDRLELFSRACDAVQFAHDKGVVHRDIKPENIMVGPHRDAYVMDWGLATLQNGGVLEEGAREPLVTVKDDPRATRVGQLVGTVMYMPPEQASGDLERVGPASDQFSLGMTLQELVTLEAPRNADSMADAVKQALAGERRELPAWVPRGLGAIIERATHKSPDGRYSSVSALSEDVRRFIVDEELEVLPDSWEKKLWRRLSKHRVAVLSVALGMVVVSAGLVVSQVRASLLEERQRAAHTAHIAKQQSQVTGRAQAINDRALGIEIGLAGLSGSTSRAFSERHGTQVDFLRPEALESENAPTDVKLGPDGSTLITFSSAVIQRASGASERAPDDEQVLASLQDEFRELFERDQRGETRGRVKTSAGLRRVFAVTASGVTLSFPGTSNLPSSRDPRKEDWYLAAKAYIEPKWAELHEAGDGSGMVLPCLQAIQDAQGEVVAVLGIEFLVADAQRALPLPSLEGYQGAWLLDGDRKVIVRPLDVVAGDVRSQPLAANAPLLDAIRRQPASGQFVQGETRFLYSAVSAVDWTYVVAAERR